MKRKVLETEKAIASVKKSFESHLSKRLKLVKISSPIAIMDNTGINDDLNGVERAVSFPVKAMHEERAVIVHSLAKWKRLKLWELDVEFNEGIVTDMKAIRGDEEFSAIHSIYVDQWDWEVRISKEERNLSYLKTCVRNIYLALKETEQDIFREYPDLKPVLPQDITYIHSEELLQRYPGYSIKEREDAVAREYGAVFVIGIGKELSDGKAHDGRAPDYDDWSSPNEEGYYGLNGDLIVWDEVLGKALELSSMGIRVDRNSLLTQLAAKGSTDKLKFYFHNLLASGELPESIGGGIGQSRVCMFLLRKKHIGEVQAGIWPESVRESALSEGLLLL
jgi:aspartate--ammonia ligase